MSKKKKPKHGSVAENWDLAVEDWPEIIVQHVARVVFFGYHNNLIGLEFNIKLKGFNDYITENTLKTNLVIVKDLFQEILEKYLVYFGFEYKRTKAERLLVLTYTVWTMEFLKTLALKLHSEEVAIPAIEMLRNAIIKDYGFEDSLKLHR